MKKIYLMPDHLKDIERAKQLAIAELNKHIDEMGTSAYDIMLKAIEDYFDFKAGKIIGDKNFVAQLNKLTVEVLDLLQTTPKFSGPVSQFVKRMPTISEEISAFQKSVNGITVPAFETAKKIAVDEIIDQMLGNGLNQNFVQPIRNLIFQNVSGGLSYSKAKVAIKEYIQGGKDESGKLGRYMEQTAIQSVSAYSGIINVKIMQQFEMNALLVTGSLIDNSSPQCRYAINTLHGVLKRSDWPAFEKIGKNHGLTPETTFDNIPILLAHWGCRHGWYPYNVIKKAA